MSSRLLLKVPAQLPTTFMTFVYLLLNVDTSAATTR